MAIKFKGKLVKETGMAREIEGAGGISLWLPKSVTIYCRIMPVPDKPHELSDIVFSVEGWKAKEIEATNNFDQE